METEFVPYEQALALKELGFDELCVKEFHKCILLTNSCGEEATNSELIHLYGKEGTVIAAPLWQQAFKWFWNTQGLYVEFFVDDDQTFGFLISRFVEEGRMDYPSKRGYSNPEIAEFNCLKALIEIVKSI